MGDSDKIYKQITVRMDEKPTEELLKIWENNDHGLWSDQAFKAIEEILSNRGMLLPVQREKKHSEPSKQTLLEKYEKPYVSWAFYLLFLFWIAFLHPSFFLFGGVFPLWLHNPLHSDFTLMIEQGLIFNDRTTFTGIWTGLTLFELGILCFGVYVGYLLVGKKKNALFWAKNYLFSLFVLIFLSFLFLNFYPILEENSFLTGSVIDTSGDWRTFHPDQISKRILLNVEKSLEQYVIPLGCIIIWYIFFAKSQWISKRYGRN